MAQLYDIISKPFGMLMRGLYALTGNYMIAIFLFTLICEIILIPMAIFFLIELYKFIVTLVEVKRPAAEGPALDEEEIKRRAIEEYLASQKQAEADAKKAASDQTEKADISADAEQPAAAEDKNES